MVSSELGMNEGASRAEPAIWNIKVPSRKDVWGLNLGNVGMKYPSSAVAAAASLPSSVTSMKALC